jgi:hypothetical protein
LQEPPSSFDFREAIVGGLSFADTSETTLERAIALVPQLRKEVRSRVGGSLSSWLERVSSKLSITPEFITAWAALF